MMVSNKGGAKLGESMKAAWIVVVLTFLSGPVRAEVEKTAQTCESQICFFWWPKLPAVKGWHQDRDKSYELGANVLVPDGSSFSDAETVMYAEALYKPRVPDIASVEALIDGDKQKFLDHRPGLKIVESKGQATGDGKVLRSFEYIPGQQGDWEQVSYGEEGDFYLIFTVSSRTKTGYTQSVSAYEGLIQGYRQKP